MKEAYKKLVLIYYDEELSFKKYHLTLCQYRTIEDILDNLSRGYGASTIDKKIADLCKTCGCNVLSVGTGYRIN